MALHNLKITVYDGGSGAGAGDGSGSGNSPNKKKNPKDSKFYKFFHKDQEVRDKFKKAVSPTTFFAVQAGINLAVQTGKQFINYYVSDIGRKHGDSNYQAIVNRRIEVVTDGLSIGQGALSGATAGSILGLPGIVIGSVLGAASSGVNIGFKYAERERSYQHQRFEDNNNQAYNLARANYSALTGRVR